MNKIGALVLPLILFIKTILFSSILIAEENLVSETMCYAEYDNKIYIDGKCDLYFKHEIKTQYTLSHKLLCDDDSKDCGYNFQIYNYDDLNIWSVNFSSDFDKQSQKMQEYLGDNFQLGINQQKNQKELCAKNKSGVFCFVIPPNHKNDTLETQVKLIN